METQQPFSRELTEEDFVAAQMASTRYCEKFTDQSSNAYIDHREGFCEALSTLPPIEVIDKMALALLEAQAVDDFLLCFCTLDRIFECSSCKAKVAVKEALTLYNSFKQPTKDNG